MITTLTLGIIGVLSLLSAIVCSKCDETYDGRAKHTCTVTNDNSDSTAWFDSVQTTLSGLIAVDWAKPGTVIDRVLNVQHMTREAASLVYDLPGWLMGSENSRDKDPAAWKTQPCLIIEQGVPGFGDALNPVLVHQASLIRGMAAFLKTMQDSDNLITGADGEMVIRPDVELSFDLVKSGGRSRYEVTFALA